MMVTMEELWKIYFRIGLTEPFGGIRKIGVLFIWYLWTRKGFSIVCCEDIPWVSIFDYCTYLLRIYNISSTNIDTIDRPLFCHRELL